MLSDKQESENRILSEEIKHVDDIPSDNQAGYDLAPPQELPDDHYIPSKEREPLKVLR